MKTIITALTVFILTLSYDYSSAQIPQYTMEVKNFTLVNSYRITFDIFLTHTDENIYEYAGMQIFCKIPLTGFGTFQIGTGANSSYQNDSVNGQTISDLPVNLQPRGPSAVISGSIIELRLGSNALPGAGNGYILPKGVPKLIKRMKLISSTPLNLSNISFLIRDSCNDNPVPSTRTKLNAYIGTTNTEITRCVNHSADYSGLFPHIICNITLSIEGLYDSVNDRLMKKDYVNSYLRNIISPYQIIDSAVASIDTTTLTGTFHFSHTNTDGVYFIAVKHKNSIETWSKAGGELLVAGGSNTYDFTTSSSQAYADNMRLKGSRFCFYSGEVNQDLIIDISDMAMVDNDSYHNTAGELITDLNGDYIVDLLDMAIIDNNRLRLTKCPLTGY